MKPLPTPYDITAIPHIPYIPTLRDWVILFSLLLVIALGIIALTRIRPARRRSPIERARYELNRLEQSSGDAALSRDICFTASQRVKWAIDTTFGTALHAAGIELLEQLAVQHPDDVARAILSILAELDREKYGKAEYTTITGEGLRQLQILLAQVSHRGWKSGAESLPLEQTHDD